MERNFLNGYNGQSTAELIALESHYRVDSIVLAFEEALDRKAFDNGMDSLTDEELIVLAVESLEREVNNGGYSQFFYNSSVEYAPMILHALDRIGCPATSTITGQALGALAIEGPLSAEAIENTMGAKDPHRDAALEECDRLYFQTHEDIAGKLFEFIRANHSRIRLP